ncbi:TPA: hypothetical protein R5R88_004548 [Salmonella enterica]|nr:hypothetical protein [Salmonella enterica]
MHKKIFSLELIFLCLLILTVVGCNGKGNKKLTLPFDSTRTVQLACYYQYINDINDVTEPKLSEEYNKQTKAFSQQETKIPVKGENFLSPYVDVNVRYYELGYFEHEANTYKLIMYNKIGESDTLLLNVQINSYDATGDLVDALLLGSFFGYEDIVRFSDFIIHQDYSISIDNHVMYGYEESKDGLSTIIFKNPIPQVYLKEQYQIENGRFKLISRMETSQVKK